MTARITTTLFLAGALLAPPAALAGGTDTHSSTGMTQSVVSDAAITTKIKAQFAKDSQVSATHIKVDTDNGVVKLSGNASTKAEADKAAAIAQHTNGVTSVDNQIQVQAASSGMATERPAGTTSSTTGGTKY